MQRTSGVVSPFPCSSTGPSALIAPNWQVGPGSDGVAWANSNDAAITAAAATSANRPLLDPSITNNNDRALK